MSADCVFCRIVAGELPAYRVAEDGSFLAIMDIYPAAVGHVLVLPKNHCLGLLDMEAEDASGLLPFAAKVARGVMEATGADGFNMLQNNGAAAWQAVMHYHAHIIPRRKADKVKFPCPPGKADDKELRALADKIKARIDDWIAD